MKPKIERLFLVRKVDDFSHSSLQTLEESHHQQDKLRLNSYGEDWHYLGIYAEAEVSYPTNEKGDKRLEWLKSSGLWGIESDSDEEYIADIEREQLDILRDHLEMFNVDTSNIDTIEPEKFGDGYNWS